MDNILTKLASWPFLNEPIWRWAVFLIALGGIMTGWNGIVHLMK